jgi:hypothetical protein
MSRLIPTSDNTLSPRRTHRLRPHRRTLHSRITIRIPNSPEPTIHNHLPLCSPLLRSGCLMDRLARRQVLPVEFPHSTFPRMDWRLSQHFSPHLCR